MGSLTALDVQRAKEGKLNDGKGLSLQVSKAGGKSWLFRFTMSGRSREMGLGSYPGVTLAQARNLATEARHMAEQGVDPIEARKPVEQENTFNQVATLYVSAYEKTWKNPAHKRQWENAMRDHVAPVFGEVPISKVSVRHVMQALNPIWQQIPPTASKVRGRIECVLDYAKAMEWREGENPARWRGHLQNLLPARAKLSAVKHFPALPWRDVPVFVVMLRKRKAPAAKTLEFLILTAARTGEVLGASWKEIDLKERVWTIPGPRMKAGVEHRVPLSRQAIKLLEGLPREGEWVFPGVKKGSHFTNTALLMLHRRMKQDDITPHGFRSSFRDWVSEATDHSRELAEMALAHRVGTAVEQSYRRGDMLEKRRIMMQDWADFIGSKTAKA